VASFNRRDKPKSGGVSWEATTVYALMVLTEPDVPVDPWSASFEAAAAHYLEGMAATKLDTAARLANWEAYQVCVRAYVTCVRACVVCVCVFVCVFVCVCVRDFSTCMHCVCA
jgi:hypothetical protein